jgi:hypothetical protein
MIKGVKIIAKGYVNPQSLPNKVVFPDRSMCEASCDIHNDYVGFTKTEADGIVQHSMDNCLNSVDLPQCPQCLGENDKSELDMFSGICEEYFLDNEEGGAGW